MKKGENCLNFSDFFEEKTENRTRSEENEEIKVQRARHAYRSNTFTINIAHWYNELPLEIRKSESTAIFKRKLSDHLIKHVKRDDFDYRPIHVKLRQLGY